MGGSMKDMIDKLEIELKAVKLSHAVEKQMMTDNFTQCKTAAEHWKVKCDKLEKELESWRGSRDGIMSENETLALKVINLACCGNCKFQTDKINCSNYDYDSSNPVSPSSYCSKWQTDGLAREERKK
jgi:hypothetical protein